jgi:hypothetical protein
MNINPNRTEDKMLKHYQAIASKLDAMDNCRKAGNDEWLEKHEQDIMDIVKNEFPSGSGFDSGTKLNWDKSTPEKLVFETSFHHMDEGGCYDGWTDHTITVTPSLQFGFNLKVSGRDRNDIKDYIHEIFS